jgi:hypothetical protein
VSRKAVVDLHFRFDRGVDLEVYNVRDLDGDFPDGTMDLSNFQCQCLPTGELSSMEGNVPVWWRMSGLDPIPDAETALKIGESSSKVTTVTVS